MHHFYLSKWNFCCIRVDAWFVDKVWTHGADFFMHTSVAHKSQSAKNRETVEKTDSVLREVQTQEKG
jgi:hypothetical protein